MNREEFFKRKEQLEREYRALIERKNERVEPGNGIFWRWKYPILTAEHVPLEWRYDFDPESNPYLMERMGVNAVFNPGAIEFNGKICLVARIEGYDRKSFFAVAESENGVDNFRFWDEPILMPETDVPDINIYDMRLTRHEDGWIYGVFCTERKDPEAPEWDKTSAWAQAGIARTKDLRHWERLDDLRTPSPQQRNVVLFPEFVDGKYAFFTRPMQGFLDVGEGPGIGWGLSESIEHAVIEEEILVEDRRYHTVNELKNGMGPAPIKTEHGWLNLAHGVRRTAAGLRYVLYLFMTALDDPTRIIHRPGGYLMAPRGPERVGDVSNVLFSGGWVARDNGEVFIYYASSDTRVHVATTTVDRLVDYAMNTPEDGLRSYVCTQQRLELIRKNKRILQK